MGDLSRYTATCHSVSTRVIGKYSTSFGQATRLLGRPVRSRVRDLYAVVRVADEIVDGPAAEAGMNPDQIAAELDRFESDIAQAIENGFSANPVIQAFSDTVRVCAIQPQHIRAFFRSMRADTDKETYTDGELDDYIYGSAEVVGLMCLDIFLAGRDRTGEEHRTLVDGARHLGAAFQKINFLRDLAEDREELGRDYLGLDSEDDKDAALEDIRNDLDIARRSLPGLPASSRTGVTAAYLLFGELVRRLEQTSLAELRRRRVRVPDRVKAKILAQAVIESRTPRKESNRGL
ncbi:phytoene/squalene synthase family protein [Kocuria koreensis]|jgi:phytoene synthase|uniref:Phytoene/squalene synthase family protein n=1 Tax=Rothia koreensis TaxID=592378 RepID=A0A7K1LJQ7_9MICC|nr:phytoene/squalene synthase family protein [Rothia koreensis]MUN55273.1 phytoene/squalene synthase family protein [Rothia koreensis]